MEIFDTSAILITLAAVFAFVNTRLLKLPSTIALMLMGLGLALVLLLVGHFNPTLIEPVREFVRTKIDFNETLMKVLLSFLLFAGALHVNLGDLLKQKAVVLGLASIGVVLSTFIIGTIMFYVTRAFGFQISYLYALIFGALISPTDPIAVLGILKKVGAPKSLETKICGESLFNDGVGVVVFLVMVGLVTGKIEADAVRISEMFFVEAGGGIILGLILGYLGYLALKALDDYDVEILITLAIVMGGYSLATHLHISGPLAMVVAGLMVGNQGRALAMSDLTREHLDTFWELVDEILNALLFVLIGLEMLIIALTGKVIMLGVVAIFIVLLGRFIAVWLAVSVLKKSRPFSPGAVKILTWGGLRGGISVALALALPEGPERDILVTVTYIVVVFSIAVQGLTVGPLIRSEQRKGNAEVESNPST